MADAGLKIVIGADLSSAITQVNQLTTGLNALGGAATGAAGVSKALDSISSSARSLGSLPASGEFVRSITAINPAALSAASGLKVLGASGTQL